MSPAISNTKAADQWPNRPVHTIRYGAVRAAIWRNIVDNGNSEPSSLLCDVYDSRSYKDGANHWKESRSFGLDDLLLLAKAADGAHT